MVSDGTATLTGLPSTKAMKVYAIAANEANQSAPSQSMEIIML